jgi:hypothetical protein
MRTYRLRNKHGRRLGHIRGYRARKKNPSADGIVAAAIAVGVGLVASVVVGYAVDTMLSTQTPGVQTGVLVALAAGSAFFLPTHPALAAGIATGLLLVPLTKQVYTWFPALANASPATQAPVLSPTTAATAASTTTIGTTDPASLAAASGMSALHMRALHMRGMGKAARMHKQLNGVTNTRSPWGMQGLHMNGGGVAGMSALHMRGMGNSFYRGAGVNPVTARGYTGR